MTTPEIAFFPPNDRELIFGDTSFLPFAHKMDYQPFILLPEMFTEWQKRAREDLVRGVDEMIASKGPIYSVSQQSSELRQLGREYIGKYITNEGSLAEMEIRYELFRFGLTAAWKFLTPEQGLGPLQAACEGMSSYYRRIAEDCRQKADDCGYPDLALRKLTPLHFQKVSLWAQQKSQSDWHRKMGGRAHELEGDLDYGKATSENMGLLNQSMIRLIAVDYPKLVAEGALRPNDILSPLYGFFFGITSLADTPEGLSLALSAFDNLIKAEAEYRRLNKVGDPSPQAVINSHNDIYNFFKVFALRGDMTRFREQYGLQEVEDGDNRSAALEFVNSLTGKVIERLPYSFDLTHKLPFAEEAKAEVENLVRIFMKSRVAVELSSGRMRFDEAEEIIQNLMQGITDGNGSIEDASFQGKLRKSPDRKKEAYLYGLILGIVPVHSKNIHNVYYLEPILEELAFIREGVKGTDAKEAIKMIMSRHKELLKILYDQLSHQQKTTSDGVRIADAIEFMRSWLEKYGLMLYPISMIKGTFPEQEIIGEGEARGRNVQTAFDAMSFRLDGAVRIYPPEEPVKIEIVSEYLARQTTYRIGGQDLDPGIPPGRENDAVEASLPNSKDVLQDLAQEIAKDAVAARGTAEGEQNQLSDLSSAAAHGIELGLDPRTRVQDLLQTASGYKEIKGPAERKYFLRGALVGLHFGRNFPRLNEVERIYRAITEVPEESEMDVLRRDMPDKYEAIRNEIRRYVPLYQMTLYHFRATLKNLLTRSEMEKITLQDAGGTHEEFLGDINVYKTYFKLAKFLSTYGFKIFPTGESATQPAVDIFEAGLPPVE